MPGNNTARIRKIRHDENTRLKIQAGNIIHRLNLLIAGEIEMPPHAVTAALGLLKKTLPDLTSLEHSGEITTTKVIRAPALSNSAEAWVEEHVPAEHRTEH